MNNQPDDMLVADVQYCLDRLEGRLAEPEIEEFKIRLSKDECFAKLYKEVDFFFDDADVFMYELFNQKEIEKSRAEFRKFAEGVQGPINWDSLNDSGLDEKLTNWDQ